MARIKRSWTELRSQFGGEGAYSCGRFRIVDAMFAPVVMRFRMYGVALEGEAKAYADAVISHPVVQDWLDRAARETHRVSAYDFVVD